MSTIVTRSGKGSPLTHAEVDSNFTNLNTDKLELSGGTLTGTLNFGDNVKAQFGASADLQIWHAGYASFIDDVGTGNLNIRAENLNLQNPTGNENYIRMNHNGSVDVYYDNSKKLETTSTGINVTGTVSADDNIYLDSTSNALIRATAASGSNSSLSLLEAGTGNVGAEFQYDGSANILNVKVGNNTDLTRMSIARDTGDISFYEDTGTAVRFFWDASEEALGIGTGTGTPLGVLHLKEDNSQFIFTRNGTETELKLIGGTNEDSAIYFGDAADNVRVGFRHDSSANALRFMGYNNAEAMRIDSSGNVGIGTTSPTEILHVRNDDADTSILVRSHSSTAGTYYATKLQFELGAAASGTRDWDIVADDPSNNGGYLGVEYESSEKFRIAASGNVGIGTSSPSEKLDVNGTAKATTFEVNGWTITESGGSLYFATGGTNKMKLDASGNLDVVGSVNANATIT